MVKQLNYLPEKEAPAPAPAPAAKPAVPKPAPATAPAAAEADDKVEMEVEAPNGKVMKVKLAQADVDAIEKMVSEQPEMSKFQAMQAVIKAKKAPKA